MCFASVLAFFLVTTECISFYVDAGACMVRVIETALNLLSHPRKIDPLTPTVAMWVQLCQTGLTRH